MEADADSQLCDVVSGILDIVDQAVCRIESPTRPQSSPVSYSEGTGGTPHDGGG